MNFGIQTLKGVLVLMPQLESLWKKKMLLVRISCFFSSPMHTLSDGAEKTEPGLDYSDSRGMLSTYGKGCYCLTVHRIEHVSVKFLLCWHSKYIQLRLCSLITLPLLALTQVLR